MDVITHRLYFVCIEKFMYSSAPTEDYKFSSHCFISATTLSLLIGGFLNFH